MPESLERPALYYPYIHVRSEHWLKATLLCIPVVKRIVPETYEPEDEPIIRRYTEIKGPFGTLLQSVPAWSSAAYAAQERRHYRNLFPWGLKAIATDRWTSSTP